MQRILQGNYSDNNSTSEFEIEKNLQIGTTDSQILSDHKNISVNENVCESEVSVLSIDEPDTNPVLDSSVEPSFDPNAKLKEIRQKTQIGSLLHNLTLILYETNLIL